MAVVAIVTGVLQYPCPKTPNLKAYPCLISVKVLDGINVPSSTAFLALRAFAATSSDDGTGTTGTTGCAPNLDEAKISFTVGEGVDLEVPIAR